VAKRKEFTKKQTVFVGLSGGVDSSVSAALLQKEGYDVVGVFIRTWHPDFIVCNEEEERLDAMRVAAHLGIPFLTFDLEEEYKKGVADYMIEEYKQGRTPNPDVMCNKEVKFGAFLEKALSLGADFVATGHYAQKKLESEFFSGPRKKSPDHSKNSLSNFLLRSKDNTKDQVYFLWTLNQEQLSKIIFPIGHLKKTEVRKLAQKFKLPVFNKKDSQGICFLGDIDLKDFLKHYIKEKRGKVLNESGKEIGYHDGAVFYTLGERHGFTITEKTPSDGAYYVVGKNIKENTLTVSQNKLMTHSQACSEYELTSVNWIADTPKEGKVYTAQIRYHGEFITCKVSARQDLPEGYGGNASVAVVFAKPVLVAPGQSVVLYDGEVVLGGGIIG
jgi:tRNA-specific 2-thiouridylase